MIARALRGSAAIAVFAFAAVAHADTRAWLDRDRIALGETATLNIQTDANAAPDYAPLLRDFDLSGQGSRQRLQWTNGQVSRVSLYAVALRPRRDGVLRLPPMRVGGELTAPLTLLVTPVAASPRASGDADVFIESEADDADPYVQQSVGWVVRLYSAVPLIAGELDQPEPANATLRRVGDDAQYRRSVGGRNYVVTERRYLLTPERSGNLVVPPARFDGRGTGNVLDQLFGDGQTALRATARPRALKVLPIPADAPTPWLPLRDLTMHYVAKPSSARTGEATRVVVDVVADGAVASQLPDITLAPVNGVQLFPERAQGSDAIVDGRPRVRLQRAIAFVPTRAGTITLPGPRIDWWDTRVGVARSTTLPPITVNVAPGAPVANADDATTDAPAGLPASRRSTKHWLLAIALLAMAIVAVALLWRRRTVAMPRSDVPPPLQPTTTHVATPPPYRPVDAASTPPPTPVVANAVDAPSGVERSMPSPSAAPQQTLSRLLELGDLADIDAALRELADARDLDAVIARLGDESQRDAVEQLRRARWAGGDAATARTRLRTAFASGPRWIATPPARRDALPPLYPDH